MRQASLVEHLVMADTAVEWLLDAIQAATESTEEVDNREHHSRSYSTASTHESCNTWFSAGPVPHNIQRWISSARNGKTTTDDEWWLMEDAYESAYAQFYDLYHSADLQELLSLWCSAYKNMHQTGALGGHHLDCAPDQHHPSPCPSYDSFCGPIGPETLSQYIVRTIASGPQPLGVEKWKNRLQRLKSSLRGDSLRSKLGGSFKSKPVDSRKSKTRFLVAPFLRPSSKSGNKNGGERLGYRTSMSPPKPSVASRLHGFLSRISLSDVLEPDFATRPQPKEYTSTLGGRPSSPTCSLASSTYEQPPRRSAFTAASTFFKSTPNLFGPITVPAKPPPLAVPVETWIKAALDDRVLECLKAGLYNY